MMAFTLERIWLIICIGLVIQIWLEIDKSSSREYFEESIIKYNNKSEAEIFNFSISICYSLDSKDRFCEEKAQKCVFDDLINTPIFCYQKNTELNETKELLKFFQDCSLDKLINISANLRPIETKKSNRSNDHQIYHIDNLDKSLIYLILDDKICIKFTYEIKFENEHFQVSMNYSHRQQFEVYANLNNLNHSHHYEDELIFSRDCNRSDKTKKCFQHQEIRHYDLSITKYNLKTNEHSYREQCCNDTAKATEEQGNSTKFNCSDCSIYCNDTWKYELEKNSYKVDDQANLTHNDLIFNFNTHYKELVLKTKSQDYEPWLLKLFYTCLLLNINLYRLSKLILDFLFKNRRPIIRLPVMIDSFTVLKLIIGFILVMAIAIKSALFIVLNEPTSIQLIEPLFEDDNISITICFELENVRKSGAEKSCEKELEKCKLKDIEEITWNETDFVDRIEIKTLIKQIKFDENEIKILYKDLLKCFNYNYNRPTLIQFSSLMRSNVLEIKINGSNFKVFYVQPLDKLPSVSTEKLTNFLLYKKVQRKKEQNCTPTKTDCIDSGDCRDKCLFEEYWNKKRVLPTFVKIQKSQFNSTLLDSTFGDKNDFHTFDSDCYTRYDDSCNHINIINLHRYNFIEKNLIQINLNPEYEYDETSDQSSFGSFVFYLFPYIHLFTSFSLTNFFRPKIRKLKNHFKLIINVLYLIGFSILLTQTINAITDQELESAYYSKYVEHIELPKITVCWNISLDTFKSKTGNDLENEGLHPKDIIKKIEFLNSTTYEQEELSPNIKPLPVSSIKANRSVSHPINSCYWLNKRCIETNLKQVYKRVKFNLMNTKDKKVFKIEIDSSKIPDKQISLYLNSNNYLTSEFEFKVKTHQKAFITYRVKHSVREDKFVYFRKPSLFLNHLLSNSSEPKEQDDYYMLITKLFNEQSKKVTSQIPLNDLNFFDFEFDDDKFLNYVHLRTLSKRIEDYSFKANYDRKLIDFDYHFKYHEHQRSVIILIPDFISSTNFKNNRSSVINLIMVLLSITSFCFNISLISLPSLLVFCFKIIRIFLKHVLILTVSIASKLFDLKKQIFTALECRE